MPPVLALIAWLVLLVALLGFDPAKEAKASSALWVPLIWIFILGSRLPMQWLGAQVLTSNAEALQEGNPLDRTVFSVLIVVAIGILMSRSFKWGEFFAHNNALLALISFALLSVIWSDFPLVAFKRWFRDLGNYLVILVVLSDAHPLEAIRTLLRRLSYLLVSLSVVLIKYYPQLGKQYSSWTGANSYVGATTSKNMLGVVCLVSVIFFFWDTVERWSKRKEQRTKRIIFLNVVFIGMTLWLLNLANSATSRVCLVIGCMVIVVAHSRWAKRHPDFLKALIPASFCVYLLLAFGFEVNGTLASAVGRDPTLTDRTGIWNLLLGMHTNALVGTGYESFWLGPRLPTIWKLYGPINESHNGYIEIYLNLGVIGLCLLAVLLITSYRNICREFTGFPTLGSLNMALWTIVLFYNMTEAAFKSHLMWVIFLLAAITVPQAAGARVPSVAAFGTAGATKRLLKPPLREARQRRQVLHGLS
jgi:exopolysaccharide production protein ExoQ